MKSPDVIIEKESFPKKIKNSIAPGSSRSNQKRLEKFKKSFELQTNDLDDDITADDVSLTRKIGEGEFGFVYEGKFTNKSSLKVIRFESIEGFV